MKTDMIVALMRIAQAKAGDMCKTKGFSYTNKYCSGDATNKDKPMETLIFHNSLPYGHPKTCEVAYQFNVFLLFVREQLRISRS